MDDSKTQQDRAEPHVLSVPRYLLSTDRAVGMVPCLALPPTPRSPLWTQHLPGLVEASRQTPVTDPCLHHLRVISIFEDGVCKPASHKLWEEGEW